MDSLFFIQVVIFLVLGMMNVFGFLYPEHFGHYVRRLEVLLKIFILAGSHPWDACSGQLLWALVSMSS